MKTVAMKKKESMTLSIPKPMPRMARIFKSGKQYSRKVRTNGEI